MIKDSVKNLANSLVLPAGTVIRIAIQAKHNAVR